MCHRCAAATATLLTTILAAGESAIVADNAAKIDKLIERGKPVSAEDREGIASTERAIQFAAKMATALSSADKTSEERYEEIEQLLRTDPERRIDAEALVRLATFTHYSALLFESLRNIVITVIQARARSERDAVCVEFALGDEGRKMERARQDWNEESEFDDDDDEPATEIHAVEVPREVFESIIGQQAKKPEYKH